LGNSLEIIEIGNEPDLFQHWNRRPSTWNVTDYVEEWLNASKVIESTLAKNDPDLAKNIAFFAPSFAGTDVGDSLNSFAPLATFAHGLDSGNNIKVLSGHKYVYRSLLLTIGPLKLRSHRTVTWEVQPGRE
jgi:hypothetical protein